MLTQDHIHRGFGYEFEDDSILFTLTFNGHPVANQLEEEALGPMADKKFDAFLRQRRTFQDEGAE